MDPMHVLVFIIDLGNPKKEYKYFWMTLYYDLES